MRLIDKTNIKNVVYLEEWLAGKKYILQYKAYSSIISFFKYSDKIQRGFWRFPHLIFVYNWIASQLVSLSCFPRRYIAHFLLGLFVCSTLRSFKHLVWSLQREILGGVNYNFSKLLTTSRSSFRPHLSSLLNSVSGIALLAFTQRKVRGFPQISSNHFSLSLKREIALLGFRKAEYPQQVLCNIVFF